MPEQYSDQVFYAKVTLPRIPENKVMFVGEDNEIVGVDFPAQETDNPWDVAYGNGVLAINNNYVVAGSERYYLSLPTTSKMGDKITLLGHSHWRITQNADDQIMLGNQVTTLGVMGYVESAEVGDCITLICKSPNRWMAHPFSPGILVV